MFWHILPWAVFTCVLTAAVELAAVWLLRSRSLPVTVVVLVAVPILAVLVFVVTLSGFMFTEQLRWTVIASALIGVAVLPFAALLGRRIAADKMAAEMAHARERAADDTRRQLVAWISHDLRAPLAAIGAMSEALEDELVTERTEVVDYGRRINRETQQLSGMIDDLFELSRIHAGAIARVDDDLPVEPLVADALESVGPMARAGSVQLGASVEGSWPTARGSATELGRVLRNLLGNAVRHTPAGGAVQVCVRRVEEMVSVSVQDSCDGIPVADLPRLFEVAFRGTTARTPHQAGAGLGLAIAKGLVESQGGTIGVQNQPPGCRFEVRIPAA